MIVVRLMGGLGNQMFQYALGRRLARDRGVPLKLDTTFYDTQRERRVDTPRVYALGGWRIQAELATSAELAEFPDSSPGRRTRIMALFKRRRAGTTVVERSLRFDPAVLDVRPPALLVGYWQSQRYFSPIASLLHQEFAPAHPPCRHAESLGALVSDSGAISVHVRRGDYVTNTVTHEYHGVCSPEYYAGACTLVAKRVHTPHFLVFSDEPDWAASELKLPGRTTVVAHDAACHPHDDIWMMSRCSHHVIANSSFGWWGAWLGRNPSKTVVAPKRWFNGTAQQPEDLIPEHWIRL
jgi:hypothetical protein